MAPKMLKLVKVLNDLESKMKPLISKPHHEVLRKLSPLERAKVGLMEVYTINSLFWVLMKTSGEDIDSTLRDDYKVEMGRLKETQSRLVEVEARSQRQRVDTQVASRMIQHGLGINRREQTEDDESPQEVPYCMTKKQSKRGQTRDDEYDETDYNNSEYQDQGYNNSEYQAQGYGNSEYQGQGYDNGEYQDQGYENSGYQEQEEELPQPKTQVKNKKKKKKSADQSMLQTDDAECKEANNDNGGYQASDLECEDLVPRKGKKKRKIKEASNVHQSNEEGNEELMQDDQCHTPVSRKKQKKKTKQGVNTSQSEIGDYIDTSASNNRHEFENDRDLSNKGRDWYEQGWT